MSVTWRRRGAPLARRASEVLARAYRERAQRRQRGCIGGSALLRFAERDTREAATTAFRTEGGVRQGRRTPPLPGIFTAPQAPRDSRRRPHRAAPASLAD